MGMHWTDRYSDDAWHEMQVIKPKRVSLSTFIQEQNRGLMHTDAYKDRMAELRREIEAWDNREKK